MNYLRLIALFFRLGIYNELAYRANFFVQVLQALLQLGVTLAGLAIVYAHTDDLGGWSAPQLRALIGVYLLVGGAINLVIRPSMQRLMEDVRRGTLDFALTKPEDAQLLISIRQIEIWRLIDVLLGAGVLVYALSELHASLRSADVALFAATLLCGGAIVYSFWLMLATLTFWFVRMENVLVIFQSMYQAGRWPLSLYPQWLRLTLTFLVPVAFAVTVPAEALIGRLSTEMLWGAVALAAAMLLVSRWFWTIGIRRYSGASA